MFKPDAIPQKRFVIFQDIRRILRKNPMERTDDQIDDSCFITSEIMSSLRSMERRNGEIESTYDLQSDEVFR